MSQIATVFHSGNSHPRMVASSNAWLEGNWPVFPDHPIRDRDDCHDREARQFR
jgi:hypothetical protein